MTQPLTPKTPDLGLGVSFVELAWAVGGAFRGVRAVWGLGLSYGGLWVGKGRGVGSDVRSLPLVFLCCSTLWARELNSSRFE